MKYLLAAVLAAASLSAGQSRQTFTGIITDEMCAVVGHAPMRMGPTDAECTTNCVMVHETSYVLEVGREFYFLSDQKTPETFAAKKVSVTGILDARTRTIQVDSITAAD